MWVLAKGSLYVYEYGKDGIKELMKDLGKEY